MRGLFVESEDVPEPVEGYGPCGINGRRRVALCRGRVIYKVLLAAPRGANGGGDMAVRVEGRPPPSEPSGAMALW